MSWALKIAVWAAAGGALGYGVSRLACVGGGCPLTSNRWLMLLLGAFLGGWLALSGCSGGSPKEQARDEQREPASQQVIAEQQAPAGGELTTVEQFEARVIRPGGPAVVDFYADWCVPCQELKPILARLEAEYAGKITFFRVNTDNARELSSRHGIRYLPTQVFYPPGQEPDRMETLPSESQLRRRLDQLAQGR